MVDPLRTSINYQLYTHLLPMLFWHYFFRIDTEPVCDSHSQANVGAEEMAKLPVNDLVLFRSADLALTACQRSLFLFIDIID